VRAAAEPPAPTSTRYVVDADVAANALSSHGDRRSLWLVAAAEITRRPYDAALAGDGLAATR
jgi:hypothetical protein